MNRRANGDGGLSWDQRRQRWIAATTVGYDGRGKRIVRRGSGRTKTEAKAKLRALLRDRDDGVVLGAEGYTVGQAVEDWLAFGLGKNAESTVTKYRLLCWKHIVPLLGARKLRELTASEVERWLARLAKSLSTETLHRVHACLNRSVKRAMARDLVRRNVVEMAEIPTGRPGRQSKSLIPEQVDAVLIRTAPDRLHNYIVVSLLTGGRTEELRALRWDHVHLEASPPHIEVWRSVRADGDTKTKKSRRTLALPARCVEALKKQRAQQLADRLRAGDRWQENGLVFATSVGTKMSAGNTRRDLRRALALIPGIDPSMWTPRELRHSFVSLLSDAGVPLEEISQLVGHSGTTVTELVYRHQLKPVIQTGATVMDRLFGA